MHFAWQKRTNISIYTRISNWGARPSIPTKRKTIFPQAPCGIFGTRNALLYTLIPLLSHLCLLKPIILLKKIGPTTLSPLSLTLLVQVDKSGIEVGWECTTKHFSKNNEEMLKPKTICYLWGVMGFFLSFFFFPPLLSFVNG